MVWRVRELRSERKLSDAQNFAFLNGKLLSTQSFYVFKGPFGVPRRFALPAPAGQRGHGATVPPRKLKCCSVSITDKSYPKTPERDIRELTAALRKALEIRNAGFSVLVDERVEVGGRKKET